MTAAPTLALVAAQILWGINYLSSKILVTYFPALLWASLRCGITAVLLVLTAIALRRPSPKLNAAFLLPALGLSLFGNVFNQICFLVGMRYTTPANSAVLCTMIPVFTLALTVGFGDETLTRKRVLSMAAGLLGVLVLVRAERLHLSQGTWRGDVLMLVNCLSYSLYLFLGKSFLQRHDRVWATAWMFVLGTPIVALAAIPAWIEFLPELAWSGGITAIPSLVMNHALFAIVGGTYFTYLLTNTALAKTEASRVALFIYLQPVVAALAAWVSLGQPLTKRTLVGAGIIFVSVFLARPSVTGRLNRAPV